MGKDVIMLLIEQMGIVLSYALNLKRAGLDEEALASIDEFLDPVLDGSPDDLDVSHIAEALAGLHVDSPTVLGVVRLLKERGEILSHLRDARCFAQYQKGLSLALTLEPAEWAGEADLVYELYRQSEPAESELTHLVDGMEIAGRYAYAEDILYDLLETYPTRENRERGRAFYNRLLTLDDGVLMQGGLPREEVLEGISSLEII